MNGTDLLAEFRETGSERAFTELVRAYTNLVYSVAKRRLSGVLLAQEAAQTVFIRLAKVVPKIQSDAELVAWLHRTTTHVSIDLWRSESRRHAREQHVAAMQPQYTENHAWNDIAPVLDEALDTLEDGERQVILLRFFEQQSMRDLGARFGITEDAAKMRVSRAVDKLRSRLGAKGAACTAAALGALLSERSVEAAPAQVALALAAMQIPALAAAGVGGLAGVLGQVARAKAAATLAAAVLVTGAAFVVLHAIKGRRGDAPHAVQSASNQQNGDPASAIEPSEDIVTNTNQNQPDPRKLLQGVASARQRILSGEMDFTMMSYTFDRPFDGTNVVRLKALFDDNKFRFESFGREYRYTSMEPNAGEVTDAKRRAENLDRQASEKAELIQGFDSHQVTTSDGAVFMHYWETDSGHPNATIYEPGTGWGYMFDPRSLGLSTVISATSTPGGSLGYGSAKSIQLIGKETVDEIPCWHVRVETKYDQALDFWIDAEHPARLIKHANGSDSVISKYDDGDPKNPIPREVHIMAIRNGSPRDESTVVCAGTRYNIAVPAAAWTLAGLGMKVGTDVMDNRIHRRIGYWTGDGLSEGLPSKAREAQEAPGREQMLALLEADPASAAGFYAAHWIILNTPDGPEVEKAADVLLRDHIQNTNLLLLAHELDRMRPKSSRRLLEGLMEKNPEAAVRGNACFTLAELQKDAANFGSNKVATAEAIKLFERASSEFGKVKRNNGYTLAELAKPELADLRHLIIGQPAPEIAGEDLDGQSLRLSDYRGKVVALVVWGHCGGCRPDVRALRDIQEHFAGRPFAIVGVFTDDHPEDAKAIAEELGMTWPSFKEKRDGPIATAWHLRGWPNMWLLDQRGVIRQRDVREGLLVKAAEELLGPSQAAR